MAHLGVALSRRRSEPPQAYGAARASGFPAAGSTAFAPPHPAQSKAWQGAGGTAAAAAASPEVGQLIQLNVLRELRKRKGDAVEGGAADEVASGSRALSRLHALHDNVFNDPRSVIRAYVIEVAQHLGSEACESWKFYQWSQKIQ